MQVTYHAANLPIYRNIYHEMKINLPLCCFLTYIYAALQRCKQHGSLRMYLFYFFRGTGAAPELSRHPAGTVRTIGTMYVQLVQCTYSARWAWSSIGRQLLPFTRP